MIKSLTKINFKLYFFCLAGTIYTLWLAKTIKLYSLDNIPTSFSDFIIERVFNENQF